MDSHLVSIIFLAALSVVLGVCAVAPRRYKHPLEQKCSLKGYVSSPVRCDVIEGASILSFSVDGQRCRLAGHLLPDPDLLRQGARIAIDGVKRPGFVFQGTTVQSLEPRPLWKTFTR